MIGAIKSSGHDIGPVQLAASKAADLMSDDPRSIDRRRTPEEALTFLTKHAFGAAPVVDDAGRPIGVVSLSDVLLHLRQLAPGRTDTARVEDIMTPIVFSVEKATPARLVIARLLELKVHHLFVVDDDGILVGVISALDVLRRLS